MASTEDRARSVFVAALEREPDQWPAFLDEACAGNAELRARVEQLLRTHEAMGSIHVGGVAGLTAAGIDAAVRAGPGTTIGRYKLLETLGEGGYGTVFMAEQTSPVRRMVALKIIKAGMDTRQVIARFEAERQALALMDHPNIAKVFDAGVTETGRPYFVMELVKGVPITHYCDEHRIPPDQRLQLFVQVCHGVQHAHQKGIIHRDLKPTNVLVALYDGVPVPKVIDFGVAKATGQRLTERTMFTGFGDVIGTPQYMSPEQAELNQLDVDTRSDIYSLGVLLYELLTGTTPLEHKRAKEAALLEVLRLIREEEPPKPSTRLTTLDRLPAVAAQRGLEPRKLASLIKGELDWIVMKALEKDRNRRYETANGVARDVERYLHDEPVHACPPTAAYRFRKFARRHKRPLLATAAGLLTLLALLVGLAVSNRMIAHERDAKDAAWQGEQRAVGQARDSATQAAAHLVQARQSERSMRQALYAARIAFAQQAADGADVPRLRELLNSLRPDAGQEDLRGFEWYHLWQICHNERLKLQELSEVLAVAYSPDGKTLLSASGPQVTAWDATSGEKVARFGGAGGTIRALAFSPDGSVIALGSGSPSGTGELTLWDAATRQKRWAVSNLPEPVKSLAFTRDGRRIAIGMANVVSTGLDSTTAHDHSIARTVKPERLRLVDVASGTQIASFAEETSSILSLAFSPDGKTLVSGTYDGKVVVWDAETGAPRASESERYIGPISAVALSPDGAVLAVACGTWQQVTPVMLHEFPSMKLIRSLRGHSAGVSSLAFLPDGRRLVSGSYDRTAIVWDTPSGWKINHHKGPSHFVLSVAASPDGRSVATGARDALACTWDVATGCNDLLPVSPGGFDLTFLPDGRPVIGGSTPILHDRKAATTRPIERMEASDVHLAASAEGSWLAARDGTGALKVFDAHTLARRHYFKPPEGRDPDIRIWPVSFSPDGKLLATGETDDKVIIRDTASGRVVSELRPEGHKVRGLRFAPDGRTLATATVESLSRTQIWDLSSNKPVATLGPGAFSIAYSADGSLLATGGATTVAIYDTHSFKLLRSFRAHNEDIFGIAFSPDGRTLATAGYDKTLRLWCVSNAELLLTYLLETPVWGVAFSPDGRTVAATTSYGAHFFDSADPNAADEGPDAIRHRWRSLLAAGKPDEAEQEVRSGIDRYTQREGADGVVAAHLTAELADLLVSRRDASRYAQAETLLTGARAVLIRSLPNGHTWRYRASSTARELYGPQAMNDAAKLAQIEASIAARPATAPTLQESGKWTVNDLDPMNAEAWKLRRDGKIEESAALRERVVAEAKRLLPPDDVRLVKYLLGYGDVLTVLKRFEEAEAQYGEASAILQQHSAPAPQEIASLAANLSRLQKAKGETATTLPTTASTTSRPAPAAASPAQQLLGWGRQSPQGVSRAVQAALAADSASLSFSPFDRLVHGEHLILGGEPSRAAAAIRQALDEAKRTGALQPYYYKSLGWALLACGESEQSAVALSQALGDESRWKAASPPADADPDQWTAAYLLSRVTQEQYTSRFSQSPNASYPWFYVGQLMEIQGKREAAVLAYQKATGLGTHHTRHWAAYRVERLDEQPDSPTSRPAPAAE